MTKNLHSKMSILILILLIGYSHKNQAQTTVNFVYTGSAQFWTVPPCVTSITVVAAGAKGGGGNGGNGARITATIAVTPGQVLQINVGGMGGLGNNSGGWNGGGTGRSASSSAWHSGGGGGASDVRTAPYALGNRFIVGGGGGGRGGGSQIVAGGAANCNNGVAGTSPFGQGGGGGTQFAGGAAGPPWIAQGSPGTAGALGLGGNGGIDNCFNVAPGGGGGGGYYGGGGGGSDCFSSTPHGGGSGGGGSSLVPGGGTCLANNNTGNGYVNITYTASLVNMVVTNTGPYCEGSTIQLSSNPGGTAYSWTGPNGFSSNQQNPTIPNATPAMSGTYTVTATINGCNHTGTTNVVVNAATNPTFAQVGPYCSGASITALPTTSQNGISGTWSPAINNTATTTYTFTPNAGLCANSTTMTIVVNPNITPTFAAVGPYCSGAVIPALPTTSQNGITGTWAPAINNTSTTTYTFTPTAGQCATTQTLTITINSNITPTFASVGPYCSGSFIPALPTTSQNGITGTWSPAINNAATTTYTFTPTAGQCATTTTLTITVSPNITPTFTQAGPYCAAANIPALPTTSLNGYTGSWSPAINNTSTTSYTFTPSAGQCATATTMTIVINPNVTPTFAQVGPYCSGANIPALLTSSQNGITGTWSPAINNTTTTTYTFTPTAGLCATTQTMTVVINPNITPTFAAVGPYCAGTNIPALPTTSLNGYTGTWAPAINNNATTTYTFTPTAGQCATTASLSIEINDNILPTFTAQGPFCSGANIPALPLVSQNDINGTWAPAINNTATTSYTFTPAPNQCAINASMTIVINPNITPTFTQVGPYCANANISELTTTSLNGYTGTWSPAINNNTTTTYTFTPSAGQCATNASMSITINPNITPSFEAVGPYCSGGAIPPLPTTSQNGYTGSWSPAINNYATTSYTFTPTAGQCATLANTTIVVNDPSQSIGMVTLCSNSLPYQWNGQSINNAGQYQAQFTNALGCDSIAVLDLTVYNVQTSTTNVQICENQAPYYWNGLSLTSSGTSTITLTSAQGCDSIATLNLTVNPMPSVAFTANIEGGCAPIQVIFTSTNSTANSTCQWNLGNGVILTQCGSVTGTYNTFGCYDVSLQVTSANGCVSSLTQDDLICVNPAPTADFFVNPQTLTNYESTANFNNTSIGHTSSFWEFGDASGTSTFEHPTHIYPEQAGHYYATLIVANSHGCTDTTTQLIIVENQVIYYIPNTFTPDGDLFNPTFLPVFTAGFDIYNYNLIVFNRWGEILFESNNAEVGWDGTYGGMPSPDGTYIWQIQFKELDKDKHVLIRGHFNLLR